MTVIIPSRPNAYTGSPLDRASHLRHDAAWMAERWRTREPASCPSGAAQTLFRAAEDGTPAAAFPTGLVVDGLGWAFLGHAGGQAMFAVDLSATEDPAAFIPPELGGSPTCGRSAPGCRRPRRRSWPMPAG